MSSYSYIKLEDEHYSKIQELYKRSFGTTKNMEEIIHKYDTKNWGYKNLGYLAVDENNDNAAYYGAFPIKMMIDGKEVMVAQSGDTMTAPEHQKKGLFVELAKKTYELAKKDGFAFVFGWPNENSYPGFKKKLDWIFTGNMQDYKIQNFVFPLCELSSKYKFISNFYNNFLPKRLKKYIISRDNQSKIEFYKNAPYGYISKDESFFDYKSSPRTFLLEINDFIFHCKFETHLFIGEIQEFDFKRIDDFIKVLRKLAKYTFTKQTIISVSENHWFNSIMKNKIEPEIGLPIGYSLYDTSIDVNKIVFTRSDFDTF